MIGERHFFEEKGRTETFGIPEVVPSCTINKIALRIWGLAISSWTCPNQDAFSKCCPNIWVNLYGVNFRGEGKWKVVGIHILHMFFSRVQVCMHKCLRKQCSFWLGWQSKGCRFNKGPCVQLLPGGTQISKKQRQVVNHISHLCKRTLFDRKAFPFLPHVDEFCGKDNIELLKRLVIQDICVYVYPFELLKWCLTEIWNCFSQG